MRIRTMPSSRPARLAAVSAALVLCAVSLAATANASTDSAVSTECRGMPDNIGYTANFVDDTISKIDLRKNEVIATFDGASAAFPDGFSDPWAVELNVDATLLYVDNVSGTDPNKQFVAVVDTCSNQIIKQIPTFGPGYEQVSPDHKHLYVPNLFTTGIQEIDTATGEVERTFLTSQMPQGGVSADEKTLWVAALPNLVYAIDMDTGLVDGPPIDLGIAPLQFTMSPDGSLIAISDLADRVAILDTAMRGIVAEFNLGPLSQPGISAFSPDQRFLWVGCYSGQISVIDLVDYHIVDTWNPGTWTAGTTISKDGKRAYITMTTTPNIGATGFAYTALEVYKLVKPGGVIRIYDTTTHEQIGMIPTGNAPIGLAIAGQSSSGRDLQPHASTSPPDKP